MNFSPVSNYILANEGRWTL